MFEDLWNHRLKTGAEQACALKVELTRIEREIDQFLDRIADATIPSIVKAYEGRIQKLEFRKIEISEKIAKCGRPVRSFDETFRTAVDFLENTLIDYGLPSTWGIKEQCSSWSSPTGFPTPAVKGFEPLIWPCPSRP